jgi:dienelactone hydrolase
MPDLFNGDPAPNAAALEDEDADSLLGQFRMRAVEAAKSFMIDMWMARHTEQKVLPVVLSVIDGCREIYAVGYCIGGRHVLLLGSETPEPSDADEEAAAVRRGPWIKVGALAHAASVTPDDFRDLKVPVSLVCVENDPLFPDDVRKAGEDAMASANLEHEVRVYPFPVHGCHAGVNEWNLIQNRFRRYWTVRGRGYQGGTADRA